MALTAVAWIALAMIWGTTFLAIRVGLDTLPPITFACMRFVLGAVLLGVTLRPRGIPLPRSRADWRLIIMTGLQIFALGFALQFWGQQFVPSGLTAVIFAAVPLLTMFIAHFRLGDEKISLQKLTGTLLGISGIGFIFAGQLGAESPWAGWGVVAFIAASGIYAWAQVTVKSSRDRIDPNVMATFQMASGGSVLLVLAIALEGNPMNIDWTRSSILALAYLVVIGSAFAMFLLYWLVQRLEVTKVLSVLLVDPIIAVVLGWIVLGEVLDPMDVLGSVVALSGLALVLRSK